MKRRDFTKTLAKMGLGALLLPAFAACKKGKNDTPVLIIGAGIAGLAAARRLKDQGFTNIRILEARNRMGGRIHTDRSLGLAMDMGASWIHGPGGNNPITPIANDANATLFVTDDESLVIYNNDGTVVSDATETSYYADYEALLQQIENTGAANKSVATAIQEINPAYLSDLLMQYQLTAYAEFDAGGPIEELSSLYWQDDSVFAGADVLFPNGYDAVINQLAEGLDVVLNAVVTQIDYSGDVVSVSTTQGSFEGKYLICTLPLGVLQSGTVSFNPALPTAITGALGRLKMGYVNKVALTFPSIFWDNNLQYVGYCSATKGQYPYFLNASKFASTPSLLTFGFGNYGLTMESQSDAQIQADVMAILRTIYGNAIPDPDAILVSRWSQDPYAKGSYSFAATGSSPADFDSFDTNIADKLFFAGEHSNHDYRGTVHGAYLSGVREADKIIDLE